MFWRDGLCILQPKGIYCSWEEILMEGLWEQQERIRVDTNWSFTKCWHSFQNVTCQWWYQNLNLGLWPQHMTIRLMTPPYTSTVLMSSGVGLNVQSWLWPLLPWTYCSNALVFPRWERRVIVFTFYRLVRRGQMTSCMSNSLHYAWHMVGAL